MFTGKPTRVITALVICTQIIASLFLCIVVPAPRSLAREMTVQFEANDLPGEPEPAPQSEVIPLGALEEQSVEQADSMALIESTQSDAEYVVPCEYDEPSSDSEIYDADQLRTQGVIFDDYCYTWYSQRILPGGGLEIEGRHVSDEGYVVDAEERIVVASSDLARGTELDVPFGSGKAVVLDTGCASGVIDIYTDF